MRARKSPPVAGGIGFLCSLVIALGLQAQTPSLTNLLAEAELHEKAGEAPAAVKCLLAADQLAPNNCDILCRLTRQYCDSMYTAKSKAEEKSLAETALECAHRAVKADPGSVKAHLCVAVCYSKNLPYSGNQTKVDYSTRIKAEAEKAIALDPKQDLSYHMLGRWHFEVANMGLILRGLVRIAYGGLPKASNEDAIQNFKKAIELAPYRIIHHAELAKVYHATGQEKLASEQYVLCRALAPFDKEDVAAQQDVLKQHPAGR